MRRAHRRHGIAQAPPFEGLLRGGISLGVAGAGDLGRAVEAAQVLPAALRADRATEPLGHPARDLRPGPDPAVGRGAGQGGAQLGLPRRVEQRRRAGVPMPPVAHAGRPPAL
jgi:hypothetical protein